MILFKKMLRDISKAPTQFFSVFLLTFCCMFVFCGITAEWVGIEKIRNDYYSETDLAYLWINGTFAESDISELLELENVETAVGRNIYPASAGDDNSAALYFICPQNENLSSVRVVCGETFDPARADGVWLYSEFADANGYSLNDTLKFRINGAEFETRILGYIISSEYQYIADAVTMRDDAEKIGYVFCSNDIISSLNGGNPDHKTSFSQIAVECSEDHVEETADLIYELFGESITVYTRDELPSIAKLSDIISIQKAMSVTFPILLLVTVIMSIVATINRLISSQRIQLGTLRALGFKKGTLCAHYIGYFVFIVLLGSFAGCITGPLVLPDMFYINLKKMFSLPAWEHGYSPLFPIGIFFVTLSCVIAAYLSVNKMMKQTPARTLRAEQAAATVKTNKHTSDPNCGALALSLRWNMRDMRRNILRALLGCVGTVSCMALLVCALSCKNSVDGVTTWMFDEVRRFNNQLVLSETADAEKISELQSLCHGECIMTEEIELKSETGRKNGIITVTEGKGMLQTTFPDGEVRALTDGEISLSGKLAENLNVDIGETILFRSSFDSKWTEATITVIHIAQSGQDLCMTKKTYEDLSCIFKPDYIATTADTENYSDDVVKEVQSIEKMNGYWSSMMESVDLMAQTMLFFAVLVAVTILYNLCTMSFVERSREFAILKVQGFKSSFICMIFTVKNVIFAFVGMIAGIAPGLIVTKIMCSFCGDDFDLQISVQPWSILIAAAVTLAVSAGVSLLFLRKIKRMDMVNSLKSAE